MRSGLEMDGLIERILNNFGVAGLFAILGIISLRTVVPVMQMAIQVFQTTNNLLKDIRDEIVRGRDEK